VLITRRPLKHTGGGDVGSKESGESLRKQSCDLVMSLTVYLKGGMRIQRNLTTLEGGTPSLPNSPVFKCKAESVLVNWKQLECVLSAGVDICPERAIQMWSTKIVRQASAWSIVVVCHGIYLIFHICHTGEWRVRKGPFTLRALTLGTWWGRSASS